MTIDFVACEQHFLDHLCPMWHALPEEVRGQFFVDQKLVGRAEAAGLHPVIGWPTMSSRLTVVASWSDAKRARNAGRRIVLSEHGAGQSYEGMPPRIGSYVGARDRRSIVAVLVPGEWPASVHRAAHPDIPAYVVGCAKLDVWEDVQPPDNADPVVALSFHWDCRLLPETRSAWQHFEPAWRDVVEQFPGAIGHAHPRIWPSLKQVMWDAGLELVPDFDEVLERADLYCIDNSSTGPEFAALGKPVLWLNSPLYRRNVHHGGRFWEWPDGQVQCDTPEELTASIDLALSDPKSVRDARHKMVSEIYGVGLGEAADASAAALLDILRS